MKHTMTDEMKDQRTDIVKYLDFIKDEFIFTERDWDRLELLHTLEMYAIEYL